MFTAEEREKNYNFPLSLLTLCAMGKVFNIFLFFILHLPWKQFRGARNNKLNCVSSAFSPFLCHMAENNIWGRLRYLGSEKVTTKRIFKLTFFSLCGSFDSDEKFFEGIIICKWVFVMSFLLKKFYLNFWNLLK